MARCLAPITIANPAVWEKRQLRFLHDKPALFRYGRDNLRPINSDALVVPCGKCLACLKNKQSSMVVRCLREAEKRGSFAFMTLTYDDDHLPIAESMWRVNVRTGSEEQCECMELVSSGYHPEPAYLAFFRDLPGSPAPRYKTFVHCRIMEYEWQIRITPSVCRHDVRQWLKQARIQYKRDYGENLPDFSYVAISEYGSRTCRPHYHLAFFGLKPFHLRYLLNVWRFGKVKQFRMVACVNKDKSSGFVKASKYIGKYMSKGKFECQSVQDCNCERPRVCQSKHFGSSDLDALRGQVLCFDMVGQYDPDTLIKPDGSYLSRIDVDRLVNEIPKRLVFRVDERTVLPLPRIIRDKIFKVKDDETKKTISASLWVMVTAHLRDMFDRSRDEQFKQFCADHSTRSLSENYAEFAYFEEYCAGVEEATLQEDFRTFYSHSKL